MNTTGTTYSTGSNAFTLGTVIRRAAMLLAFLLLVIATHPPQVPTRFASDDYLQRAVLQGSEALASLGFSQTQPDRPVLARISDTFQFFSDKTGSLEAQRDYGNLPWWTVTKGMMHPFRPLAAFTHWLDMQLWPDNRALMQAHSLLYLILFVAAALSLYQRLTSHWPLALLATALLVFDYSTARNFEWLAARNAYLAVAFGMLSIRYYLQWREDTRWRCWWIAMLCFAASLLSAEAGLATAGYLGAYALVYDRRGWKRGLVSMLPFAMIVLIWRGYCSLMGFGASHIGLYLDPGRDPLDIIERVMEVFPLVVVSLATGIDGIITAVDLAYRFWVRLACWLLVAVFVRSIVTLLKTSREARFMFLGSVFAVIPHCTLLSAGSRSGTFVAIGFFFVLAQWIIQLVQKQNTIPVRVGGSALMLLHLFIPVSFQIAMLWHLIPVVYSPRHGYPESAVSTSIRDTSLVFVTSDSASLTYYLPYQWDVEGKPLPKRLQVLAPGLNSVYLVRTKSHVIEMSSPAGFVLNQDSPILQENLQPGPPVGKFQMYRMLEGLVTTPNDTWKRGTVIDGADMKVTVLDTTGERVTRVRIEMTDDEPFEKKLWQYYDWKAGQYKTIPAPAIGESLYIPGALDSKA